MIVGLATIELQIPASQSLKDKRQEVRSLVDKVRREFNVSISEVDHLDSWQLVTLGVACVSKSQRYAEGQLQRIVSLIETRYGDIILLDYEIEWL